MQSQDPQAIARRPLDVEDYIDILRRHKAWILGPAFAALVAAVVIAFLWPDTYVSAGVIRVVPPQVPESLVPTNINMDMQGRVNNLSQIILSRSTLTTVINTYGLYKKEMSRMPLDDVIESMKRNDIKLGSVQSLNNPGSGKQSVPAFQIGFAYSNRFIAQKVAQDLMARFLEENQRAQTQETTYTTQFLQDRLGSAKKKLDDFEGRLSTFRSKNIGRLPDQQTTNYQQLNAIQSQMVNLNTAMSRVNQDKLVLESQLRIYKDNLASMKDPSQSEQAAQQKNEKLAEKEREVMYYETNLAQVRERYKESHPDVQRMVAALALAKRQRDALLKEEETKKPEAVVARAPAPQFIREQRDLDAAIRKVQGLIEAKDLEMQDYQKEAVNLTASMKGIQGRLEGLPSGQKDYEELVRDRDLAKREYEDADSRATKSESATMIINRQQGERLEMLDTAPIPQTPTEPKRPLIILAGTGLGLIIGLFLAGAREVKDGSLKNLKDVRAYTQLPVLGSIPLLENDLVVRRRRRLAWLAWSTACLVGAVIMSSSVVYYFATKV